MMYPVTQNARLVLAPMHGLTDAIMRDVLTRIGGFDECVTEFVRITHTLHGKTVWLRHMSEIATAHRTFSGTPVTLQLLGSDENMLAQNALQASTLGITSIDLNFGCPAPTVNRHQGGAILLNNPQHIEKIVKTLRIRLPATVKLSAKMRLGYHDKSKAIDCAKAIENGGASHLTIHARTKAEGYTPPAHWNYITKITQHIKLPIIANGDVFSLQDYLNLRNVTGVQHVMLGRGAISRPDLARQIATYNQGKVVTPFTWHEVGHYIMLFFALCMQHEPTGKYALARLKQWLNMLKTTYTGATELFNTIRAIKDQATAKTALLQHFSASTLPATPSTKKTQHYEFTHY